MVPCDVVASITLPGPITNSAFGLSGTDAHEQISNAVSRWRIFFISLQNVNAELPPALDSTSKKDETRRLAPATGSATAKKGRKLTKEQSKIERSWKYIDLDMNIPKGTNYRVYMKNDGETAFRVVDTPY